LVGTADRHMRDDLDRYNVVLVQTASGVVAVVVERVVTSYDLVVKNIGTYVKSISGIAGVSMLGNGEVVPVLDLAAMLQIQENSGLNPERINADWAEAEDLGLPKVMIVDDSLSVRNSLSQLMRDSGYEAILARDGLEAINLLRAEEPNIVLTDLEMPRMNGFDLISYIRNTSEWRDLPVVMITSRNMAKHRQQAEAAGVNRFIAKPFNDDEILECIETELSVLS
ncbi:MAG: response regulator, partial [Gammaproteobacteria bacterium]|nr:response regulator [Gammaproteobacteria bacterium]